MKQIAQTILLLLAFCALPLTAQAQDVKKAIRAHYAEAKAYVDQVKKMEAEGFSYPVPHTSLHTSSRTSLPRAFIRKRC